MLAATFADTWQRCLLATLLQRELLPAWGQYALALRVLYLRVVWIPRQGLGLYTSMGGI